MQSQYAVLLPPNLPDAIHEIRLDNLPRPGRPVEHSLRFCLYIPLQAYLRSVDGTGSVRGLHSLHPIGDCYKRSR